MLSRTLEEARHYAGFAGRKLAGFVVATVAMVITGLGSLGLVGARMLDGSFATNITLTVCVNVVACYSAFAGFNAAEHRAKQRGGKDLPNDAEGKIAAGDP